MSITALITMMPLAALIVFGETFFALWVPNEDAAQLNLVSMAAAVGLAVACSAQPLQNVFVITNSQRSHSAASLLMGLANVGLATVLLNSTDWGVYAILAAAAATTLTRVLVFTVPMAGRRVQATRSAFLPEVGRSVGYLGVLVIVGLLIRLIHAPNSWVEFLLAVTFMCLGGGLANVLALTARADRQLVFSAVRRFPFWKR